LYLTPLNARNPNPAQTCNLKPVTCTSARVRIDPDADDPDDCCAVTDEWPGGTLMRRDFGVDQDILDALVLAVADPNHIAGQTRA
jgi:hypothetical protein